jgi:hypothetical protein
MISPPQRDCPLRQPVQPHGFRVILHLSRDGLADWRPPPADDDARAGSCPRPALRAAWPQRSLCSPPFPPLTIAAHTVRSTSRPSRRPVSTRLTSGNASRTGAVARACRLERARAHLQALLTSLAHHGLHRTQPPDIRNHRQQAVICAITQLRLARAQPKTAGCPGERRRREAGSPRPDPPRFRSPARGHRDAGQPTKTLLGRPSRSPARWPLRLFRQRCSRP